MLSVTLKRLADGRIYVKVKIGYSVLIDRVVWVLDNGEEITVTAEEF